MPMYTNGVYQDKSVPGKINCGVGRGVGYTNKGSNPGMGGNQYKPSAPSYAKTTARSHDKKNNKTYA